MEYLPTSISMALFPSERQVPPQLYSPTYSGREPLWTMQVTSDVPSVTQPTVLNHLNET